MIKVKTEAVYLFCAFIFIVFFSLAEAKSFESDVLLQMSKVIAEKKLIDGIRKDMAEVEPQVYISNSLKGTFEKGNDKNNGEDIGMVCGLNDLDKKFPDIVGSSIPSTIHNNIIIPGEQVVVPKNDNYRGYSMTGREFERLRTNAGLGGDRIYIINDKYKDISWYSPKNSIKLDKYWTIAGGVIQIGGKPYTYGIGDWMVHNKPMDADKYLPQNASLHQIIKLDQAFQREDYSKIQFNQTLYKVNNNIQIPKTPAYNLPRINKSFGRK